MRFPDPVAVTCVRCGQPTVVAETSIGGVRVHCGTWRWQCDTTHERHVVPLPDRPVLDADGEETLAA